MLQVAALRVGSLSCGPSLSATRRVFSLSAALHARLHIPRFLPDDFPANSYIHPYIHPHSPHSPPHHHHPSQPLLSRYPPRNKITMASNSYVVQDSDNDDDPDLALAIKLSLQEGPQSRTGSRSLSRQGIYPFLSVRGESSKSAAVVAVAVKRKADLIVISDTESDEDTAPPSKKSQKIAARDDDDNDGQRDVSNTIMGLDRGRVERERLARLSIKLPVSAPDKLRGIMPLAAQRNDKAFVPVGSFGKTPAATTTTTTDAPRTSPHALEFSDGVVKKTWVRGVDRDGTDVKFEEVLRKETLIGAVLSAFQWDHEWLWTKIPNGKLQRFVLVMQAKGDAEKEAILNVLGGLPKTTIVFPDMEKGHCMHSKLMLLFHRNRDTGVEWLRIAIPSANLTDYDWGEGGTMENTVFIIDLPKLRGPSMIDQTIFHKELFFFCKISDYPVDILARLLEYNFSATAPLAFVHSICGTHYGPIITRTGYGGLGSAISALGYNSGSGLEIDVVSASIGATDKSFIMNMYRAAQGFSGITELARRPPLKILSRKVRERLPKPKLPRPVKGGVKRTNWDDDDTVQAASESDTQTDEDADHGEETSWGRVKHLFRLHFPSHDTVATSRGGTMGGGTLCCMKECWEKSEYPRSIFRDCKSVREGIVMHNKMLFARPARTALAKSGRRVEAWAYVGSANFTVSAWGKMTLDRGKRLPMMKCHNWECGVVVPVFATDRKGKAVERTEPMDMEVFAGIVPVPMQVPGEPIDGILKKPWFRDEAARILAKKEKKEEKDKRKAKGKR